VRRKLPGLLIAILVTGSLGHWVTLQVARAEECDNPGSLTDLAKISGCINTYSQTLEAISKANATNAAELHKLKTQITNIKNQIVGLEKQLEKLSKDIFEREVKIGVKQELLSAKVRQDYVRKRDQLPLLALFSAQSAADFFRDMAYRERLARADQELISAVSAEVADLESQKSKVKSQNENLKTLKRKVDGQADFLQKEVDRASAYVADLGSKISALTARQQALLAEKTGTFTTSVGDVPLADDPAARPDYNPGFSPAFAMFSFGAPHFKGMSQYGAFGRAKSGQSYETILKAYYGNVRIQEVSTSLSIRTTAGTMDFENRYMRGIAEMPSQWGGEGGMEALRAQAIAARSYALAYTGWRMNNQNANGTICVTEACQVWRSSKADNPGAWAEAVNSTRGKILVSNNSNEVVNAWYASTSGGYQESYSSLGHNTPGFWDTTSDWTRWADGAWEKTGGSPWFYKGWYKSRSGKTCGRSHPWLKMDEFADMVNAAVVVAGGGDVSGIFPEDVRSCWGGNDNPWSKERLAEEADKHGGRVTSVSSVRVDHGNNGVTSKVVLGTNRGEITISGANFKKAFNLRAPGALALKSGLFNIEKK
jgi:peptidoglycan hydrolase CwlO-like protein